MGRPLAEPSDDPKVNERRRKAREQARDRASTAKQLKLKGIGARESLDRKQERKSSVMKEKDCEEQLTIVKKELKRKQAQIKFLAENINKVDASSSSVKGDTSVVKIDKNKIDALTAKVDDIAGEDINAVDTMSRMMKQVLESKKAEKMKEDMKKEDILKGGASVISNMIKRKLGKSQADNRIKNLIKEESAGVISKMIKRKLGKTQADKKIKDLENKKNMPSMTIKIQNAIRAKNARLELKGRKFAKITEAKYNKKISDEKRAKNAPKKVMTDEERAKRDATFGKGL